MTITSQKISSVLVGNGVLTQFAFDFPVNDDSHVKVFINGAEKSSGVVIQRNLNQDASPGGTVALTPPPANGVDVEVRRVTPATQETAYPEYGTFPAATLEQNLDKLTALLIERLYDKNADRLEMTAHVDGGDMTGVAVGTLMHVRGASTVYQGKRVTSVTRANSPEAKRPKCIVTEILDQGNAYVRVLLVGLSPWFTLPAATADATPLQPANIGDFVYAWQDPADPSYAILLAASQIDGVAGNGFALGRIMDSVDGYTVRVFLNGLTVDDPSLMEAAATRVLGDSGLSNTVASADAKAVRAQAQVALLATEVGCLGSAPFTGAGAAVPTRGGAYSNLDVGTRLALGDYRFTFTTPAKFPGSNLLCHAMVKPAPVVFNGATPYYLHATLEDDGTNVTGIRLKCYTGAGAAADVPNGVVFSLMGFLDRYVGSPDLTLVP